MPATSTASSIWVPDRSLDGYATGLRAAAAGHTSTDNPYRPGTAQHEAWRVALNDWRAVHKNQQALVH